MSLRRLENGVREANTVVSRLNRRALAAAGPMTKPIGSLVAVRTSTPHTVLTFDDGPEPGGTDRVLSVLADHGATATFFVLLNRAKKHRGLLSDIVAAGHEVGLHGVDHRRLTSLPPDAVAAGLADGAAGLADLLGAPVRYFRPPHGAQTPSVWHAIRRQGLRSVLWGPCAWDWLDRPVDQLAGQALRGLGRGTVLLAHDGLAGRADGERDDPAARFDRGELVRRVLDGIGERGYAGRSLSDALVHGEPVMQPWFRR